MGNRLIKDSIRTSKSINAMTDFQFRLWVYLLTYVDDYGRGSADPELLKGFVFPRRKGVTEATIQKTLAELATIGSVILYEVDGEPYLCFPTWSKHQTVRNKISKFPGPEDRGQKNTLADGGEHLEAIEINCNQLNSIENICVQNPESNPESIPESGIQNPRGKRAARATPPTLADVMSYAEERGKPWMAQKFFEYFEAGNWVDAKGQPVRNWKQKFLTWEKYNAPGAGLPKGGDVHGAAGGDHAKVWGQYGINL